ncbi:MAG TPA: tripartite tricarboxylate transporter substrate binding protein [Roseomonas sp.]|jgi:tripartite-type tricarboxylate transporter receptor subunit TctC
MKRRTLLPMLAATPLLPHLAQAQTQAPARWSPDRPVRFIVGFAPGGSTDVTARVVAQGLSAGLGQQVVVENRTGAAGNIATEFVARSAPDGHTLIVASVGSQVTNAQLYRNLPFDPVRDFAPVTLMVLSAALLVVRKDLPVNSVADLIAHARANPEALNCGTAGPGSTQHFAAALFENRAGIRFTQVSYRGGAPAMQDLVTGRLDVMFTPVVEAMEQVRAGQVKALGVTATRRSAALPDVAPIAEALPGYEFNSWLGLFAPASTPRPAIERLSREVATAMRQPGTGARLEQLGYQPVGSTPEEFGSFFMAEIPRVAELVRITGATAE